MRRTRTWNGSSDGRRVVLHVGCGPAHSLSLHESFHGADWRELRLDIDPSVKPDIIGTIVDMSAVSSESVDAVWSSHNLEHVYPHEVPLVLNEFFRVLRPSGTVLVTVPDLELVAQQIAKSRLEDLVFSAPLGRLAPLDMLFGYRPAMASGNLYMAHHTGFTARTLRNHLHTAGFDSIDIKRREVALWAHAQRAT